MIIETSDEVCIRDPVLSVSSGYEPYNFCQVLETRDNSDMRTRAQNAVVETGHSFAVYVRGYSFTLQKQNRLGLCLGGSPKCLLKSLCIKFDLDFEVAFSVSSSSRSC